MADKSMDGLNTFTAEEVKVVDTTKKMRIGIIGCGWIADSHAKSYLNQPDVEIVAGADLIPGKAAAFMAKHGIEGAKTDYASHKELLADKSLNLDAVSICTYNRQHAQPAIDALNAGIHVLLEKPFTVTLDEAIEVVKAEKKSGKVLSIGFQPRLDPNMIMVKEIVQSGVLGDVYYVQTGGGRRRGIPTPFGTTFIEDETAGLGALADIGCYSLDMVLNAIGYPKPLTVSGFKTDFFGKDPETYKYKETQPEMIASKFGVDDFAGAFIRLEGGVYLDFRISWALNIDTPGDTLILGTKAGLRIPSTNCWNGTTGGPMTIYRQVAGQEVQITVPLVEKKPGEPTLWQKKIGSFLSAIENGTESPVPTSQIIINQAIIDAIVRSADAGEEVKVTIPEI